jgi:AraC-like DNA-binding protein
MPEGPTIDRTVVKPIFDSIAALGGDVETLVEDSGLLPEWSDPTLEKMPEDRVWELFDRSARMLDMPDVGLRVGSGFEVRDLGTFGRQLENSLTTTTCLTEYIHTVNRYSSHSKFWLECSEGGVWFCRHGIDLICVGRDHVEQFTLQLMIALVRLACGPSWFPSSIRVQAINDRFYRDDPSYGRTRMSCKQSSTAIWISSADMLRIVRWDDDAMIRCIRESVIIGPQNLRPTLHATAGRLGFSVRSLQRELSTNGLNWSRLLEQIRLARATGLLETNIPLAELALELGYTDAANFGRAFRRWTGTTPRSYRRLIAVSD